MDFLLDFHFLWSNAREDGTQRQSHWGNSNVHQSNDNLQSSFNSVSHFWKLWENSFLQTYPSYESQNEIEKSEAGSEDPDVDHGNEGKD